jgi:diacylglycerol kinase (ATP)
MDQGKKWVFIINPVAGSGYGLTLIDKIKEMILKHGLNAEMIQTERKGHATDLAQRYADNGYTYIIGVGGDGTLNEIARPLLKRKDIVIGLIAAGTGNDFIQIAGFPDRFEESDWEVFFRADVIKMDVGQCNGKIFLNGLGLGFDAQVAAENYTEEGEAKEGWKYRYIWHIIKTLFFFREKRMTVVANGSTHETDCFINTVANGRRFAGSFFLTPNALANDGLLDVCSIKRLNLLQRIRLLMMVPGGTHIYDKKVNYFQTDKLVLEFPSKVPFHVDGEIFYDTHFEVSIMPEAVNLIYNPERKHFFREIARVSEIH